MGFILDFWLRFNQNRHARKITGSRITAFYAALSIGYCAIQVIFLAASWQANYGVGRRLEVFVQSSASGPSGDGTMQYSYLDYKLSSSPQLRLCPGGITSADHGQNCPVIWPKPSNATSQRGKRADSATVTFFPATGTLDVPPYDGLTLNGVKAQSTVTLSPDCVEAIKWPYHHLLLLRREDVAAAIFHSWLFFMSVAALMTESIPHIWASFALHVIALFWSSFQMWATQKFNGDYHYIITGSQGACGNIDLISDYFKERTTYQIATTVVNFVSAIASGFLCWRLFGMYGWLTFKKMGASRTIARAYKCALAFGICIQLLLFFYTASVTIFLDQMNKNLVGSNPDHKTLLIVGYAISIVCVAPWCYTAWYGIRRENKKMMYGFFILSVLYLGVSGAMFTSITFRRTFEHWTWLATSFSISWVLLTATVILAVFCTLNFGKGLPHYFERRNGEDADDYSDDFHPSPGEKTGDLESVTFPGDDTEVVVAFPSRNNSALVSVKRSESALSHMSQESRGSTRLPPLQVDNARDRLNFVILPPQRAVLSRNLTASSYSQTTGDSAFSPSWSTGDDKAMMSNPTSVHFTASSLLNYNSTQRRGGLDRGFSFGTRASSDIMVPIDTPQRSASKSSVATTSTTRSHSGRKKRFDLSDEL